MADYFFDTSALVKYYHPETGAPRVQAILEEPARQVRISTLGLLEAQSVFAMKVRSSQLGRDVAGLLRARLMLDIAAGSIEIYTLTEDHFAEAERLIGRFAFSHRLRTAWMRFSLRLRSTCHAACSPGMNFVRRSESFSKPSISLFGGPLPRFH